MTDYVTDSEIFLHRFGDRIVANWRKQPNKVPGGPCMLYTYDCARKAMQQLGGAPFPSYNSRYAVCALWGNHIDIGKEKWLTLPDAWRGRGAPGALMYEGRGTRIYEGPEIFQGALEPGAAIQVWQCFQDYIRVFNGDAATEGVGHSLYFREYVRDKHDKIVGMKVMDAKYYAIKGDPTVRSGEWAYWCATNLRCVGGPFNEPMPWPPAQTAPSTEGPGWVPEY